MRGGGRGRMGGWVGGGWEGGGRMGGDWGKDGGGGYGESDYSFNLSE